jgi:hypothetical protein
MAEPDYFDNKTGAFRKLAAGEYFDEEKGTIMKTAALPEALAAFKEMIFGDEMADEQYYGEEGETMTDKKTGNPDRGPDNLDSDNEFKGSIVGPGFEKGPLVDKMPSPGYRKLAVMIAKGRRSADDLRALIKEHAAEGHLRPGEAGVLKRELDSAFAPNAKKEEANRAADDVFVEDGIAPAQKPMLFRKPVAPERKSVVPAPAAVRESQAPKPLKQGRMDMVIVNTGAGGVGIFTRRK